MERRVRVCDELLERGYTMLPSLDKVKCDSIVEQLSKLTFQQWRGPHTVRGFDYDSACSNLYEIKNQKLVIAIPEVLEVSNNPNILALVEKYLGGKPIQTQADCWWSVHYNESEPTWLFHQDGTYKKFIKLFLYLNDITTKNGPHVYVPGSLNRMITPNKYHISQRIPDDFIKENYSEIKYFTGDKGTMMLVDTRGWHKGNPVEKGHRILIQLEWTTKEFLGPGEYKYV